VLGEEHNTSGKLMMVRARAMSLRFGMERLAEWECRELACGWGCWEPEDQKEERAIGDAGTSGIDGTLGVCKETLKRRVNDDVCQ